MLSYRDLLSEIKIAEKVVEKTNDNTELLKVLVKLQSLQLKLLHSIRANSVRIMRHQGIELIEKQPKEVE